MVYFTTQPDTSVLFPRTASTLSAPTSATFTGTITRKEWSGTVANATAVGDYWSFIPPGLDEAPAGEYNYTLYNGDTVIEEGIAWMGTSVAQPWDPEEYNETTTYIEYE